MPFLSPGVIPCPPLSPLLLPQVSRLWPGSKDHTPIPYDGWRILEVNLRYYNGSCYRIIEDTAHAYNGHGVSACWFDLYVPACWFTGGVLLSYLLLRFCVRDPH